MQWNEMRAEDGWRHLEVLPLPDQGEDLPGSVQPAHSDRVPDTVPVLDNKENLSSLLGARKMGKGTALGKILLEVPVPGLFSLNHGVPSPW